MYEVKEQFLWFNKGQELDDEDLAKYNPKHVESWKSKGHIKLVEVEEVSVVPDGVLDRIKDFTEDVLDDGKRNRSNKKPKKSKKKKK